MKVEYFILGCLPASWEDFFTNYVGFPNITINQGTKEDIVFNNDGWIDVSIVKKVTEEKAKEIILMICQDKCPEISEIEIEYLRGCMSI